MDNDPLKSRPTTADGGAAEKSTASRPKTVAERKRDERARKSEASSRGVRDRLKDFGASVGDRMSSDAIDRAGGKISAKEAEEELYHAHVAAAKVMRSEVDLAELREEFKVAGESFATVANHIWPPLRLLIRFIAPLVLAGALIAIWAAILAETPWVRRLGAWWSNRDQEQAPPAAPSQPAESWSAPHVVQPPHSPAPPADQQPVGPHPPVPDVRSMRQR